MTLKTLQTGDAIKVHDSVSKYCGMSGTIERKICNGIFSVRFSEKKVATLMFYQISKNGR